MTFPGDLPRAPQHRAHAPRTATHVLPGASGQGRRRPRELPLPEPAPAHLHRPPRTRAATIRLLIAEPYVRIVRDDGQLLRELTLHPETCVLDVLRYDAVCREGIEAHSRKAADFTDNSLAKTAKMPIRARSRAVLT